MWQKMANSSVLSYLLPPDNRTHPLKLELCPRLDITFSGLPAANCAHMAQVQALGHELK